MINVIFMLIPPVAIFCAIYAALRSFKTGQSGSKAMKVHFVTLVVMTALCLGCTMGASAATTDAAATAAETGSSNAAFGYIAAALSTGLAAIGGGIALGSSVPAAIGATSENPKTFGKSLIFVALGETLALYGLIISFMIITKL